MSKKNADRIRSIYSIALSIVIGVAAICLIYACIGIYQGKYQVGENLFSREAVARAFSGISLPIYLCLVMIAGGFVLDAFLPGSSKRPRPEKQYTIILKRLHEKTDLSNWDDTLRSAVSKQQKKRQICKWIAAGVITASAAIFLIYAVNGSHYHQSEINASMIHAMYMLLPCLAVSFACAAFTFYYCRASIRREIELMKQVGTSSVQDTADRLKQSRYQTYVRWTVLLVGIVLLIYGFQAGGTEDVLTKAVNICTECVGLG